MTHCIRSLSFAASWLAVAALAAPPPGLQHTQSGTDERRAEVEARLEAARERLQLSDEQEEQLVPILGESLEATMAVLEKHGVSLQEGAGGRANRRRNLRRLRALGSDLDEVREALLAKIEAAGFLTDQQFAEFKKIQEEQRATLRERMRAQRGRSPR